MRSEISAAPQGPVDILDVLLAAPADKPVPGQEALVRLIRRAAAKEHPRPAAKAAATPTVQADRTAPPPRRQTKVKTTHYLDTAIHTRLGAIRDRLDGAPGAKKHGRVSKSRIVETALRQALDDFEAHGRDSRLGRALETALDEA
jgi:hypothetical protein